MILMLDTLMLCGGCIEAHPVAWSPTILFFGWYTFLGAILVCAASVLLRGDNAHQAVSMVGLYLCTIVTGGRVWELWFTLNSSPDWLYHLGLYWIDEDSIWRLRMGSLWIAWPFLALASHCLITGCGHLLACRWTWRNRIAVILCGIVLGAGLLCPLLMHRLWHAWLTTAGPAMAQACTETRTLSDAQTADFAEAYPDDWRALLLRARYLADVGRYKEAQETLAGVRRVLPSDQHKLRERVERAMQEILEHPEP